MYVDHDLSPMPLVVAAQSLASAAVINQFVCKRPVNVEKLAFLVSTATVSTGNIVISVYKRQVVGSSSGQSLIDTLTIPSGVAAGVLYYSLPSTVSLQMGQAISFEVTTAAAGGGSAGAGYAIVNVDYSPESMVNNSSAVLSA